MKPTLVFLVLLLLVVAGFFVYRHVRFGRQKANPQTYADLRNLVFTTSPETLQLSCGPQEPWTGLVDIAVGDANATLVVIADHTVSLYLSTGGGWIGCGADQNVWDAAEVFFAALRTASPTFYATHDFSVSLPAQTARFYAFTRDGKSCSDAVDQEVLVAGGHTLSRLFIAADDIITQVRHASDRK